MQEAKVGEYQLPSTPTGDDLVWSICFNRLFFLGRSYFFCIYLKNLSRVFSEVDLLLIEIS